MERENSKDSESREELLKEEEENTTGEITEQVSVRVVEDARNGLRAVVCQKEKEENVSYAFTTIFSYSSISQRVLVHGDSPRSLTRQEQSIP